MNQIPTAIDSGKLTGIIHLDLNKTFATVDHKLLLRKLKRYGVTDVELDCMQDYLSNRTQMIKIGDTLSDEMPIPFGIRQGSILEPLMFIMYINDFPIAVRAQIVMYVDDIAQIIFSHNNSV